MKYDISRPTIKIIDGIVDNVYPSGLLDVKSKRGGEIFQGINVVFSGPDITYNVNDEVVCLSDGAKHFVIGKVRLPVLNESGNSTIKNLKNDFYDLVNSQALVATDDMGTQSRVIASTGGGVIVDGGELCVEHFDPYLSKITRISEREEKITIPSTVILDHNDEDCEIEYRFRGEVDNDAINNEFQFDADLSKGKGFTSSVKINNSGISIENRQNGEVKSSISISPDGSINISNAGDINITSESDVKIQSDSVEVKTNGPTGKVSIGNDATELLDLIDRFMTEIINAKTLTFYGAQPLVPATATVLALKTELDLLKE
ncbi:MAG: hypothetical protein ACR2MS_07910 [Weeksellaceae bacterium]